MNLIQIFNVPELVHFSTYLYIYIYLFRFIYIYLQNLERIRVHTIIRVQICLISGTVLFLLQFAPIEIFTLN